MAVVGGWFLRVSSVRLPSCAERAESCLQKISQKKDADFGAISVRLRFL
jgi:hypothetical protein